MRLTNWKRRDHWFGQAAREAPAQRRYLESQAVLLARSTTWGVPRKPRALVEILEHDRSTCGVVMRPGVRRSIVLMPDGKRQEVQRRRIIDRVPSILDAALPRQCLCQLVRELDEERERLACSIDVEALWEAVADQPVDYSLEALAGLCFEWPDGLHEHAALARALVRSHAFVRHGNAFRPVDRATLEMGQQSRDEAAAREAECESLADRLACCLQGEGGPAPEGLEAAIELLKAKVLHGNDHPAAVAANALSSAAHLHNRRAIFAALVKLGVWQPHEHLELLAEEIPVAFSPEAVEEAAYCRWPASADRWPIAADQTIVALPESFGGMTAYGVRALGNELEVACYLASPACLMPVDGALHAAALDRAATLDMPDRRISLLPEALQQQAAFGDGLRPALTIAFRFAADGELLRTQFLLKRLRLGEATPDAREAALTQLCGLALQLRGKRHEAGAMLLPEPQIRVETGSGGTTLVRTPWDDPDRLIAEEFEILMQAATADWCIATGIPAIYETHPPCPVERPPADRYDPVACYEVRRRLTHPILETEPGRHHRHGIAAAVPVARPWDACADLLMHQQIVNHLQGERPPFTTEALEQALQYTALARNTAREISIDRHRYWQRVYLGEHCGEPMPATILAPLRGGCFVELDDLRLWTFCPLATPSPPAGSALTVRITAVSPREGTVRMIAI